MPLHIPLMTLLMMALAASTLLVLKRGDAPQPRPGYAIAGDAATSPYGSGAALRNLLF